MRKLIVILTLLFSAGAIQAQVDYSSEFITSGEHNSYEKVAVDERPVIHYPPLREADVKFSRRVVRCIDSRQKMNKQLEWPRNPLNRLLYEEMLEGNIRPYRTDSLASYYNLEEFTKRGGTEVIIWVPDDPYDPTIGHDSIAYESLRYEDIKKYWLMEEWIFDYKHSVFKPRIIALVPLFKPNIGGMDAPEQPLCWIKMDEIRPLLARTEMFNRYNDAMRLSFDDFFQMRIFDSYIVFESNVFDMYINFFEEYEDDSKAALRKSDEIKNDLFIFEHDLWQY